MNTIEIISGGVLVNNNQTCLLKQIMEVEFVLTETALYLNTHPNDEMALRIHNTYAQKRKELVSLYEAQYSPLTNDSMSKYPWGYIDSPWPWEFDFTSC